MTSLTGMKLDRTCGFENYEAIGPEGDGFMEMGIDGGTNSVSADGKTLRFVLEFVTDKRDYERNMVIKFENFGSMFLIPEAESEVLIKGAWIIDFPLKYKDLSETYRMNSVIPVKSGALRLERVDLSPISCFLEFSAEEYSKELQKTWSDGLQVKVRMKDKSLVHLRIRGTSWVDGGEGDTAGSLEGVFSGPIGPEQAESLILRGEETPLNK